RDKLVTGVQTCALPISQAHGLRSVGIHPNAQPQLRSPTMPLMIACSHCNKRLKVPDTAMGKRVKCPGCGLAFLASDSSGADTERSEERRVGKECRWRWW